MGTPELNAIKEQTRALADINRTLRQINENFVAWARKQDTEILYSESIKAFKAQGGEPDAEVEKEV